MILDIILKIPWFLAIPVCCTFCSISILFYFIVNILSCFITSVQHLRLDYCENFELAWKEKIDKLKWNMSCFWRYYHVLSKHWQPFCSIYSKCSNATSWLGKALFTWVNSFMEALINMICELKITSGSKKNCVKIPWWSDIPLKSYQRKTVLRGHEIHSSQ